VLEELNVSVLVGVTDTTGELLQRVVTVSFTLLLTVGLELAEILPVTLTDPETVLEELNVSVLLVVADTTGESVKRAVTLPLSLLLTVGLELAEILPMTLGVPVTLTDPVTLLEELNVSVLLGVTDTTGESVKRAVTLSLSLLLTVGLELAEILPMTLGVAVTLTDTEPV
jgi:hypothetical protein